VIAPPFVVLALLLAFTQLAAGDEAGPRTANIDDDDATERIVPQQVCQKPGGAVRPAPPACTQDELLRRRVAVEDTCQGRPYTRVISSVQDTVDRLRVTDIEGVTNRPEVFFDMRSGATGRSGDVRAVRFDLEGPCWKPHRLFRYPTRETVGAIPRRAVGRGSFTPSIGNFRKRYRGKEIRMVETYVDRDDAFCCPSFRRVTDFRYSSGANRYVRYRTVVFHSRSRTR